MALLKAFRALRYDSTVAGPLDALVAPPYDVIPEDSLGQLASVSPYNVVRLIRPHEPDLARQRFRDWQNDGVLVREEVPAVWRLEEHFVGPDGVARTRTGLVARVRVSPFSDGVVLPHERTFPGPTESRLRLIEALGAKVSPVLMLHDGDPPAEVTSRGPDLEATLESSTSRLWRIDDADEIARAVALVKPPFVIADGHHRYTAALRHHEMRKTAETEHVLATLVSVRDPGLEIFPTHRLLSAAPELDGQQRRLLAGDPSDLLRALAGVARDHPAFVAVRREASELVELAPQGASPVAALDVTGIDTLGVDVVGFTPSAEDAVAAVHRGTAGGALLVRAPTVAQVEEVARAGLVMPPKSTYFFPKLTSGLLLAPLDE